MPDYSKLHDMLSHRIRIDYDTGAHVSGYLASCQPAKGQVEFVVLKHVEMVDSKGQTVGQVDELTLSPNVTVGLATDEGPRGR
ncbi:MAG: hypothetical protein IPL79_03620 [Myxococcales bacterium]|nr:hypothetical protein [Myxococcales bacterium]